MIPLPLEIERLEIDLINRKITGSEASMQVFIIRKKLGPPWHWKSWKIARKKYWGLSVKRVVPDLNQFFTYNTQ